MTAKETVTLSTSQWRHLKMFRKDGQVIETITSRVQWISESGARASVFRQLVKLGLVTEHVRATSDGTVTRWELTAKLRDVTIVVAPIKKRRAPRDKHSWVSGQFGGPKK